LAVLLLRRCHLGVIPGYWDGGLVFHAVPALVLFASEAGAGLRWAPGRTVLPLAILCAWAVGWCQQACDYRAGGARVAAARADLATAASAGAEGRPLGIVTVNPATVSLQLLLPQTYGLLLQRPFVDRDLPAVG